jgi:hypothetical protein
MVCCLPCFGHIYDITDLPEPRRDASRHRSATKRFPSATRRTASSSVLSFSVITKGRVIHLLPFETLFARILQIPAIRLAMPIRLKFGWIFLLFLSTITDANAASTLKVTCSGKLSNTSTDGVTLGDCDLNFISVRQMGEIEGVCGIPGTIDTPAENQCRIKAVVSPDPISTADKRRLYKVLELWSVDKR